MEQKDELERLGLELYLWVKIEVQIFSLFVERSQFSFAMKATFVRVDFLIPRPPSNLDFVILSPTTRCGFFLGGRMAPNKVSV